jgi:hypothetical protein
MQCDVTGETLRICVQVHALAAMKYKLIDRQLLEQAFDIKSRCS